MSSLNADHLFLTTQNRGMIRHLYYESVLALMQSHVGTAANAEAFKTAGNRTELENILCSQQLVRVIEQ